MKKNFIFAAALTLIFAIISCSSNDYEESINTEMSKSRMTKAVNSVTYDDIQAKVDEIDKKLV